MLAATSLKIGVYPSLEGSTILVEDENIEIDNIMQAGKILRVKVMNRGGAFIWNTVAAR